MKIYFGTDQLPLFEKPVITIGTFDGVHKGHRQILKHVVAAAQKISGTSILISFEPHPRKLIFPNESLFLLSTMEERLDAVRAEGIDVCVVVPFTADFAAQSAQQYIERFLMAKFHPHTIVIGYDHRFGSDRQGNIDMLKTYAPQGNFLVEEISAQLIDEATVSSTYIRKALSRGDVATAAKMLGDYYSLQGKVALGRQLGRTIGYPTANIAELNLDKLIPANGVYAVWVEVLGKRFGGMLNIGTNPTVSAGREQKIEVHLFHFTADIYTQPIKVCFVARIRDEQKFDSIDALKQALQEDEKQAMTLLA